MVILTPSRDGIPSVDAEIRKDLIDLDRVDVERPESGTRNPFQLNVFADQPSEHLQEIRYRLIKVDHLWNRGLLAGKGQQLPGEVRRALRGAS